MSNKTRMRLGGYPPFAHNEVVQLFKTIKQLGRAAKIAARDLGKFSRTVGELHGGVLALRR